jgi:hypothetical protein
LIQGNGTVYTIDSCYKNGGPHPVSFMIEWGRSRFLLPYGGQGMTNTRSTGHGVERGTGEVGRVVVARTEKAEQSDATLLIWSRASLVLKPLRQSDKPTANSLIVDG